MLAGVEAGSSHPHTHAHLNFNVNVFWTTSFGQAETAFNVYLQTTHTRLQ